MSKAIEIRCHGQFYAREGQLKLLRDFEEIVKAPSLKFFEQTNTRYMGTDDNGKLQFKDTTFINVRGVLKKKLLPLILSKKYMGQFVRVRGVVIDEIIGGGTELEINLMSFPQLTQLIKQRNMPLDAASYVNVDELRTDVTEYMDDPDTFQRNYARKSAKRSEEREFMELNNLMPSTPTPLPIPTAQVVKAKKGIGSVAAPETTVAPY